jgi:hypothetical protein
MQACDIFEDVAHTIRQAVQGCLSNNTAPSTNLCLEGYRRALNQLQPTN